MHIRRGAPSFFDTFFFGHSCIYICFCCDFARALPMVGWGLVSVLFLAVVLFLLLFFLFLWLGGWVVSIFFLTHLFCFCFRTFAHTLPMGGGWLVSVSVRSLPMVGWWLASVSFFLLFFFFGRLRRALPFPILPLPHPPLPTHLHLFHRGLHISPLAS